MFLLKEVKKLLFSASAAENNLFFSNCSVCVFSAWEKERPYHRGGQVSSPTGCSRNLHLGKKINKIKPGVLLLPCDSRSWDIGSHLVAVLSWVMNTSSLSPETGHGRQVSTTSHFTLRFQLFIDVWARKVQSLPEKHKKAHNLWAVQQKPALQRAMATVLAKLLWLCLP